MTGESLTGLYFRHLPEVSGRKYRSELMSIIVMLLLQDLYMVVRFNDALLRMDKSSMIYEYDKRNVNEDKDN